MSSLRCPGQGVQGKVSEVKASRARCLVEGVRGEGGKAWNFFLFIAISERASCGIRTRYALFSIVLLRSYLTKIKIKNMACALNAQAESSLCFFPIASRSTLVDGYRPQPRSCIALGFRSATPSRMCPPPIVISSDQGTSKH